MARLVRVAAAAMTVAIVCWGRSAGAEPRLRLSVDQKGDFLVIGNTLGQDCAAGIPAPTTGTVSACGTNTTDTSPDVFWRADEPTVGGAVANTSITPAMARSTAILNLPTGAQVTHARLYWSAAQSGAATDRTVLFERVGADPFSAMVTAAAADEAVTASSAGPPAHIYYQATADVTALVQAHGSGTYRVGDVDSADVRNVDDSRLYAAWTLVVFYRLDSDPFRNITLFDGLDIIETARPMVTVTLRGFLVPAAAFDAKLAVIAYEGDDSIAGTTGDSLSFNATRLTNALNPVNNFFNNTRSALGAAVSNAGDLPRLSGAARSMSGYDADVVTVTDLLHMNDSMASIQASTQTDFFVLGAFITSISTFKPDFSNTSKTFVNTSRSDGGIRPGDVLEYTVTTTNNGNDPGAGVVMRDILPANVTFVPGSLQVAAGAGAGTKTDAAGDDQGEYDAANRTVIVRLGAGATASAGGTIDQGGSATVKFQVRVNADATGTISNQAVITAAGQSGSPTVIYEYRSDGNGPLPGTPPTDAVLDACQMDADCPAGRFCNTTRHPFLCGECRTGADCTTPTRPICDTTTSLCRACTADSECPMTAPLCEIASGKCVQCRTSADCSGLTPLCVAATSTCGPCTGDGPAGGCIDPARPACNTMLPLAGACTECSATNSTRCMGAKPQCQTAVGLCGCNDRDGDSECGGNLSGIICNGAVGICQPGCSEAPMRNRCPIPQACSKVNGEVGECMVPSCLSNLDCPQPRTRCDVAAVPRTCVGCLVDADCATGYICDSAGTRTCVECTSSNFAGCSATNAGSRCLTNNTCGCTADSDCGTNISGRVCDATVYKCTYGCRGIAGNGCPPGLVCSSTTSVIGRCLTPGAADAGVDAAPDASPDAPVAVDAAADVAVADAAPLDAGLAEDAGVPDAAADLATDRAVAMDVAPARLPDTAAPTEDAAGTGGTGGVGINKGTYVAGGGCTCDTGRTESGTGLWAALLVPVAILVRRRRRRAP
jgi:uncharacterized repeat protein (TIGR01451 family)